MFLDGKLTDTVGAINDGKRAPNVYIGLCALYFETRARHGYRADSAMSFVKRMTTDFYS